MVIIHSNTPIEKVKSEQDLTKAKQIFSTLLYKPQVTSTCVRTFCFLVFGGIRVKCFALAGTL